MGVLKRKEEPTETMTLRVPASVKAEIDRLRERTSEAGFDLNGTICESIIRLTRQMRDEMDGLDGKTAGRDVLESLQQRTDWHIQIGRCPPALLMLRAECEEMCVGVRDRVGSVIGLLRSGAGGRRALSAVLGGAKEWGKGRSFVEQDKASAVQCRRSVVFSNFRTAFPPLQGIWSGQRHSTAKIASERVVPRLHFECFWHARTPVLKMLGPVIAVAFLVALGRVLSLRISLTDSAAPAGIYRIVHGVSVERGELVGACLPPSIAQEGWSYPVSMDGVGLAVRLSVG
jgi:hypothetical protein